METNKIVRALLIFFLGWIGSIIINHSSLKPEGWTSRTWIYVILGTITFGIYTLLGAIFNLLFDPTKEKNLGYKKD